MKAKEIALLHLRALEAGNWDEAMKYIADDYRVTGLIPFPISLFVKIGKKDALRMHKPRKRAMPETKTQLDARNANTYNYPQKGGDHELCCYPRAIASKT